jgi:hypothetical protein
MSLNFGLRASFLFSHEHTIFKNMKQFEFRRLDQNCGHSGSKYKANFTDFPANSVNKGIHNNEPSGGRIYIGDREI